MNVVKTAHTVAFSSFAIALLAAGIAGFLLPYGLVPWMKSDYGNESLHLVQEAGSGAIALGLLAAWCAFNYDRSRSMHFILLVFFTLFTTIHWVDYFRDLRPLISGIINSIPTVVLAALFLARPNHDSDSNRTDDRAGLPS